MRQGRVAGVCSQPAASCQAVGGVDPGGQHTASGGALRVRCDVEHRSAEAGVDPASWIAIRERSCLRQPEKIYRKQHQESVWNGSVPGPARCAVTTDSPR